MQKKLIVAPSPFLRNTKASTRSIMLDVIIALLPTALAAVWFFGAPALSVMITCVLGCVISEWAYQKMTHQTSTVGDLSAVVTGLLLAFNMPASAPWWMGLIGSVIAIVLVKQIFGGIGQNFINPALAARTILMLSWTVLMAANVMPQAGQFFGLDASLKAATATPVAVVETVETEATTEATAAATGEAAAPAEEAAPVAEATTEATAAATGEAAAPAEEAAPVAEATTEATAAATGEAAAPAEEAAPVAEATTEATAAATGEAAAPAEEAAPVAEATTEATAAATGEAAATAKEAAPVAEATTEATAAATGEAAAPAEEAAPVAEATTEATAAATGEAAATAEEAAPVAEATTEATAAATGEAAVPVAEATTEATAAATTETTTEATAAATIETTTEATASSTPAVETTASATSTTVEATSVATPLSASVEPGQYSLWDLFSGNIPGMLGETCKLTLLLGGLYLIFRRVIDWRIPVSFIVTAFLLFWIHTGVIYSPESGSQNALYQLLSGGLILGAFFMATDYVTSPISKWGRVIMGIGCAVVLYVVRFFNAGYPEGCSFAILFMNVLTPLIDRYTARKPFGYTKQPKEKGAAKA
ncbi:MAG: RnfABCDGE type electron transport complex subunit D [Clostridia bacterium]|nr:RnfABCDGE type electron transport complex subunit D [Clostridia bacterium]